MNERVNKFSLPLTLTLTQFIHDNNNKTTQM